MLPGAGLDLGDGKSTDRGIGISLERRWPLCAMLRAPATPMLVDVGLCALLEARGLLNRLSGFLLFASVSLLLNEIDAGAYL
jgi:hypothetical protein